jgi:Caspase domain
MSRIARVALLADFRAALATRPTGVPPRTAGAFSASMLLAALCLTANFASAAPARRALLVGINIYKWSGAVHKDPDQDFRNLAGAAGDAIWLKSILTSKYGFRGEDVIVLTDAAATRDAVLTKFRSHLIAKSAPGDVALFYFAGHGSRAAVGGGLEDTIVPADSRDPAGKVFDITSSELHTLFVSLVGKTQNVTSILDSCYADTTVRDVRPTRSIKTDMRIRPQGSFVSPQGTRGGAVGLNAALDPITPVVRISASRADQESEEYTEYGPDGKTVQHGLMSYELFREMEAANDRTTWRDVMDRTRTEVAKQNATQDPQMEAPTPDTLIFGGVGLAASEPFLLVTPQRQTVTLNAGSLHAIENGTELDVYPPGAREFTGKALARVKVTNVTDTISEAIVISGAAAKEIPEGARAVIRSRPVTAFRFRIFFQPGNELVDEVRKAALNKIAGAEPGVAGAADAVVRFADASLHTEHPDGEIMSPPVPAAEAGAVDHVVRQLGAWTRWRQLLTAEGGSSVLQLKVTDEKGNSPDLVVDGSKITVALCNTGTRPYFTRVVYFSSDGAITPVDLATDGMPLAPGECKTGGSFVITVDEGRKSGTEFFKAFATLDKVDLEPFTGDEIRDPADPAQWSSVTKSLIVSKP